MMVYTIISDDMQSYDLPARTIKLVEKFEALEKFDALPDVSIREKFKRLHSFIIEMLGKDVAREFLGGDKLDEIDTNLLTLTYKKIVDAYEKPLNEYNTAKVQHSLDEIPLDRMTELIKATEDMKGKR